MKLQSLQSKFQGKDRQKNPPLNIVRTGFRDILKHPAI